jgi:hypothetical protein
VKRGFSQVFFNCSLGQCEGGSTGQWNWYQQSDTYKFQKASFFSSEWSCEDFSCVRCVFGLQHSETCSYCSELFDKHFTLYCDFATAEFVCIFLVLLLVAAIQRTYFCLFYTRAVGVIVL